VPRTDETNQRIRDEQRAKILEAAWRVFARKGWATTMADVAASAEVSYGLAYHYFANKEALFDALVEQMVQSGIAGSQHLLEMPGTPGERLAGLIGELVANMRDRPESSQLFSRVMADEAAPADLRELVQNQGRNIHDALRRLIVEGQASGEVVSDDPDQLVTALLAYLDGMANLAAWNPEQFHRHFPDAGIAMRMLRPRHEPV
jgi:AcrR family transcriptional regulator